MCAKFLAPPRMLGLATLLEGAGYFFNIPSIQNYILTPLWLKKCVKFAKKVKLMAQSQSVIKWSFERPLNFEGIQMVANLDAAF